MRKRIFEPSPEETMRIVSELLNTDTTVEGMAMRYRIKHCRIRNLYAAHTTYAQRDTARRRKSSERQRGRGEHEDLSEIKMDLAAMEEIRRKKRLVGFNR